MYRTVNGTSEVNYGLGFINKIINWNFFFHILLKIERWVGLYWTVDVKVQVV